jgi:outer membrane biosynthesis protein TonB
LSPDRDEDFRETIDDEPRSIFSAFWFRVVLVILALGVVAAVALPYLLDVIASAPPPAARTAGPPDGRAAATAPTPAAAVAASAPAVSAPEPAPAAAAPATSGGPAMVGRIAEAPGADAPPSAPVAEAPKKAETPTKVDAPRKAEPPGTAVAGTRKPAPATVTKAAPSTAPASGAATPTAKAATPTAKRVATAAKDAAPAATDATPAAKGAAGGYWVQVGAFRDQDTARRIAASLRGKKFPVDESVKRTTAAAPALLTEADRYSVVVSGRSGEEIKNALSAKSLRAEPGTAGWTIVPAMPLAEAVALSRDLAVEGLTVQVRRSGAAARPAADTSAESLHRVRVGPYPDRPAAVAAVRQLETAGYKPFIARGSE